MSLTGIALAIGVIVDNGIIMSENAYRHLAEGQAALAVQAAAGGGGAAGARLSEQTRMELVKQACIQVSRGVFFSTVIIIASFLPVFLLTGQEGEAVSPPRVYEDVYPGGGRGAGGNAGPGADLAVYAGAVPPGRG